MDRLTAAERRERLARWLVAAPGDVARGLEGYLDADVLGALSVSDEQSELERALLERSDPLIILALAKNAADDGVLRAIYLIGKQPPTDATDTAYKAGLRAACLGNAVRDCSELSTFPTSWMGQEEFAELIRVGDQAECEAVLSNRRLADHHLIRLYQRDGPFSGLNDDRWMALVGMTARNARLTTEIDYPDSPDLGFMHIHEALTKMLATYPMTLASIWGLFDLLERLNPFVLPYSSNGAVVQNVLNTWRECSIKGFEDEELEGEYTPLSKIDELRCLVVISMRVVHPD